jgi:chitodextrinase
MKLTHPRKIKSFIQQSRLNATIAIVVAVGIVVTGAVIIATHASGSATLTLSPATSNVALGNNIAVTIRENSSTVEVNAVEADLVYDKTKFQFVSIDTSTSPFNLVAQAVGGNGTVTISSGATTVQTGQQTVAIVTFKAIGLGSSAVTFANTSVIVESTNHTDTLGTTTGATYNIQDQTAPSIPTGLTAGTRTATSIALSWSSSSDNVGVTGYNIYRGGTKIGSTAGVSYTDTGLSPSNNYSYTVTAYDAVPNTSSPSSTLSTSTTADTTNPTAPTGLTLNSRTMTSISFKWTAATDDVGVTGYKIYRGSSQVGTSTGTSYNDTGLSPDTSYTYKVYATDAANHLSVASTAVAFATLADTVAPSVPTNLTSPSQTTSSANLSWTASTDNVGVTGYRVYRNGSSIGTTSSTSYSDTGLTSGVQYSYTVAAYDAAGNTSAPSTARTVTVLLMPGDANGDGHVNISDLSILSSTWLSNSDLRADFNNDNIVNIQDLSIMATNWGR